MDDGSSQYVVLSSTPASGVYASGLANPDDWLWDALSGERRSESGISVSAERALQFAPWFQGISIIAGDVARMPLDVFERTDEDDRIKHRDHFAYELLNRRANKYMSAFTVRETLLGHALSWGNGYAAIDRIGIGGRPGQLVPLAPEATEPRKLDNGEVAYHTRLDDKSERVYAARDVIHVRGFGTGLMGYSVFQLARDSLGLGLVAEQHASRHFRNGARPGVVLKHPAKLDKVAADELLDAWESRHGQNPSRPALAAGGLDVTPFPVNNQDAQLLENRKFQRDEVASWLALPPHKLGSDSRLSYNSVEAEERAYVSQTLMRWLRRFEIECDLKLLTAAEQRKWWYFEHNVGSLIQGDFSTQSRVAVELKNAKIITRNEARKKFNLNSVEDGDVFENANTTSDTAGEMEPEEGPPEEGNSDQQASLRQVIVDRLEQITKSECTSLKRLSKANHPVASIESLYERLEPKIADAMCAPVAAYNVILGGSLNPQEIAAVYCRRSQDLVMDVVKHVGSGGLPGALEATIGQWPAERPQELMTQMEASHEAA